MNRTLAVFYLLCCAAVVGALIALCCISVSGQTNPRAIQIIIPTDSADRILERRATPEDWEAVRTAIDVAGSIRDMRTPCEQRIPPSDCK